MEVSSDLAYLFRQTISLRVRINGFFRAEGGQESANKSHEHLTESLLIYNNICPANPTQTPKRQRGHPSAKSTNQPSSVSTPNQFEVLTLEDRRISNEVPQSALAATNHVRSSRKSKVKLDTEDGDEVVMIAGDHLAEAMSPLRNLMELDQLCGITKDSFVKAARSTITLLVAIAIASAAHVQSQKLLVALFDNLP